jgi:FkbM family methyltransferase
MRIIHDGQTALAQTIRFLYRQLPAPRGVGLIRRHLRKLCVDEELEVGTRYGFRIAASPRDYTSHGIYFFGEYDAEMSSVLLPFLRPGAYAWDIGAERGWFTLLMAAAVGGEGRVESFEAFPPNYARLKANIERNGFSWVAAHCLAVKESKGEAWFVPPADEITHNLPALRHCSGVGYVAQQALPGALRVDCTSIDEHADRVGLDRLEVVKMDVEGAEVAALHGGRRTITRFRPMLAVEYNRPFLRRAGTSWQELDALLAEYGYDRFIFRGSLQRFRLEEWDDKTDDEAMFNVYAFPRTSRPGI